MALIVHYDSDSGVSDVEQGNRRPRPIRPRQQIQRPSYYALKYEVVRRIKRKIFRHDRPVRDVEYEDIYFSDAPTMYLKLSEDQVDHFRRDIDLEMVLKPDENNQFPKNPKLKPLALRFNTIKKPKPVKSRSTWILIIANISCFIMFFYYTLKFGGFDWILEG